MSEEQSTSFTKEGENDAKVIALKPNDSTEIFSEVANEISDTFVDTMGKFIQNMADESRLNNVAIFVDYDNVYHGLTKNYQHDPDHNDPTKNLFIQLWNRYGRNHIRAFRAYADFEKLKSSLTSLQKKRVQIRHVYSNGKLEDGRKNSSDIELSIDAIDSTYKDQAISTYVFVTADSDMIPVLSRLMYRGKRVELFYLKKSAPQHVNIESYADYAMSLEKFLNVEIKEYQIEKYVLDALRLIDEWYRVPQPKNWVGLGWLKRIYSANFDIPENEASELLEYLKVNNLICEGKHQLADSTVKTSIKLTSEGSHLIESLIQQVAATNEQKNS